MKLLKKSFPIAYCSEFAQEKSFPIVIYNQLCS